MSVVLADDETLLREGLARLLTEAGFEVAGTARDRSDLVRIVEARRPDLVVTDIKMPPEHHATASKRPLKSDAVSPSRRARALPLPRVALRDVAARRAP